MKSKLYIILLILGYVVRSEASVRTVYLQDVNVTPIAIQLGRSTILSFPTRPSKVIVGSKGQFAIEYIESDLAIAATTSNSRSNLVVYLQGRRFTFDLTTSPNPGDEIVQIRDAIAHRKIKKKNGARSKRK